VLAQTSVRKILNGTARRQGGLHRRIVRAVGLTWWVEKLRWFRGSLDEMRSRIMRHPAPVTQGPIPRVPRAMEACGRR
jgi:hypothetical protein